jgi:hypothetical protein
MRAGNGNRHRRTEQHRGAEAPHSTDGVELE